MMHKINDFVKEMMVSINIAFNVYIWCKNLVLNRGDCVKLCITFDSEIMLMSVRF